ncbi:MAG: membrane dipeptidase [Clostridiales bacterium]|nr:membrane dipeptidase [Clostridiales bacterium]
MNYIDLHCDTLTACCDSGQGIIENNLQADVERLKKSGCTAQCFAIFTEGASAPQDFEKYLSFYLKELEENPEKLMPVTSSQNLKKCVSSGILGGLLTVENLSFIGDDLSKIACLSKAGVKMASLVWNNENLLASPNLKFENGVPQFLERSKKGLTDLGRQAVEELDKNKIIVDISHLSDGGAEEILNNRKIPVVASHSNCERVCRVSRNLTDGLIKKLADCGGVIGVNYCMDFLGDETFESVARHISHIINIGGEDSVALGSDFDGIPAPEGLEDCTKIQKLLTFLEGRIGISALEKLAHLNFERVFKEVCG